MTLSQAAFPYSNSTPIVFAIGEIIGVNRPDVLVLDYRRDKAAFRALWALTERGENQYVPTRAAEEQLLNFLAGVRKTIILVDIEESSVITSDRFGRHLSALSWAHCLTHRLFLAKKNAPNIAILDLRNDTSVQRDATFTDFFGLPSSNTASSIRRFDASLGGLNALLAHIAVITDGTAQSIGDITTFAKRWKAALVDADSRSTRHDLNNAIGPLALTAAVGSDSLSAQVTSVAEDDKDHKDQLTRAAALSAMKWVVVGEMDRPPLTPIHLQVARELRILLLDDQAANGWLPVLCHYLGFAPTGDGAKPTIRNGFKQYATTSQPDGASVSLWYATSPDNMMGLLNTAVASAQSKVERFRFTNDTPSGNDGNFDELLLLDLRLFGGDASNQADTETSFLRQVSDALATARKGSKPHWISQIENGDFREKPEYLQALTGLAQLIAEVDFSYPIVVWSSTGQRTVTECLRDFKNVFTGLEKPRFDSYMSHADDFCLALGQAFQWATKQLQAATIFENLMLLRDTRQWAPPGTSHPYAEVYIEEDGSTRNQNFKVGALIAFYKNEHEANELHKAMGRKHFGKSVIPKNSINKDTFSSHERSPLEQRSTTLGFTGEGRLPKKLSFDQPAVGGAAGCFQDISGGHIVDPRREVASKLKNLLQRHNVECAMVTSCLKANTPPKAIDPRYLFLLSDVLRVAFTLMLKGKKVRVFVATKRTSIPSPTERNAQLLARDYFERWGVLSKVERVNHSYASTFASINNHSALHAAIDAHSYSDGFASQAELYGARGVTLSYKKAEPRPAHYEWQVFENIVRENSGNDAAGKYQLAKFTVIGKNGQSQPFDAAQALADSFPCFNSIGVSWRHLHYYVDELLEEGARNVYVTEGVIARESWFDRSLLFDDPNKESQLRALSCGRSIEQEDWVNAIASYVAAAFNGSGLLPEEEKANRGFHAFVGERLAVSLSSNKSRAKAAYEQLLMDCNP